jgi:hypothetical protein
MQAATRQLGRPYRMTEGNSCFHGGKPLVSDTLASGLWSGDYMLQVAQAGYIGVNLHGGGNGLDTPIAGDTAQGFVARPVFCGMLLAQSLAGSTFVESNLSASDSSQNVTAFASRSGAGRMRLAIFNKASAPMKIRMALGCAVTPRFTLRYVVRQNVCWQNEKVCAMCGEPTSHS